ncbi:Polypeptide N-acetylgalactosaminyltransferase 2, partial [Apostichopus japonicus]
IPDKHDLAFGSIKQGAMCLDTLGHTQGGTIGLYECHNSGGNQEFSLTKDGSIKHAEHCLSLQEEAAGSLTDTLIL